MPVTRNNYTLPEGTVAQITDLAQWWGGVDSLPRSRVVAEAIRRAWEAEAAQRDPKPKRKEKAR